MRFSISSNLETMRLLYHRAIGPIALRVNRRLGRFLFTRGYFDFRYRQPDPWKYLSSAYESRRHALMMGLLSQITPKQVLEIGCSEGVFTEKLATAFDGAAIVGVDISARALRRAAERVPRAKFILGDVRESLPEGRFDLILCTEVMYYLGTHAQLAALRDRLTALLTEKGKIMLVHARPEADLFHREIFGSATLAMCSEHEETSGPRPYLISVFARR